MQTLRSIFCLLVVSAILFVGCQSKGPTGGPAVEGYQVGNLAPDFTLSARDGSPFHLKDLRGKVVFLNFWATWCGPCRVEMPSIEALHKAMVGKDFVVVAVAVDEGGWPQVDAFAKGLGLTFTIVLDQKGDVAGKYHSFRLPETLLINKEGVIVDRRVGAAYWSEKGYLDYFNKLLGN